MFAEQELRFAGVRLRNQGEMSAHAWLTGTATPAQACGYGRESARSQAHTLLGAARVPDQNTPTKPLLMLGTGWNRMG